MNKNELVHLHALLARVAEEYVDQELATREDFEAYQALGTTPMALRKSRNAHETATLTLANTLGWISAGRPARPVETDTIEGPTAH